MILNDINDDYYILKRYMMDTYDIYISPTIFYFEDNIYFYNLKSIASACFWNILEFFYNRHTMF